MNSRKKQLYVNAAAFLLLFLVSLYRQISLRRFPSDPFRTYILFACYLILLTLWAVSIRMRVTQRSMRVFLLWEDTVMMAGLTIRFVQDTFLTDNIPLLRITGLLVSTTLMPIMIFGLFVSLCIGREDDYRIPRKWYLLLIPAGALCPLILTDNIHHFFTYIIPEEPQPNLTYHPNTGFFLTFGLILALAVLRVLIIYKRNDRMKDRPLLRRIVPLLEGILLLVFFLPYILNWMQENAPTAPPEVIEQYAKLYYIEVVTWEFYIRLGLVPVNKDYREVFEQSTLGLQIISADGEQIRSRNAEDLTPDLLQTLQESGKARLPGRELWLHHLPGGDVVWTKDVSELQRTITELNQSAEKLAQEGILIQEELKTKNEKTRLAAKNEIYDTLVREVRGQLDLIRSICREPASERNARGEIGKLFLLGTYVKRRCNLRLTEWENGSIENDDLALSLRDMAAAMGSLGIQCTWQQTSSRRISPRFALKVFDSVEAVLEEAGFRAERVDIRIGEEAAFIDLAGADSGTLLHQGAVFDGADNTWHVTLREDVL